MNRAINCLLLLFVGLCLVFCVSNTIIEKGRLKIDEGMDMADVTSLFGKHEYRLKKGSKEIWQYCETVANENHFLAIWFTDKKTTGTTSYSNPKKIGACSDFFISLPWGMAPDAPLKEQVEALQEFLSRQMRGLPQYN